jgi:malate dehydrogenase
VHFPIAERGVGRICRKGSAGGMKNGKVVVIGGGGGVGSTAAFSLATGERSYDLVLTDARPHMITSHVMDLENAVALASGSSTVRGGVLEDAADAEFVVFCAAAPLRLNASRSVYLAENHAILAAALARLRAVGFEGVLLLLSNPVDPLLTWVYRQGWPDRRRLIGYALNDSLRLRTAIAARRGVHPRDVDAWVVGEHGAGQVPLFSRVSVHGNRVKLDEAERAAAKKYLDTWYTRHVALDSKRTSTWSSGLGVAHLIRALASDRDVIVPACVALEGEYGVHGIGVGVPAALGRGGVRAVAEWDLERAELDALRDASRHVEAATDGLEPARR